MHNLVEFDKNENNTQCENYQDYFSIEEEIAEEEIPLSGRVISYLTSCITNLIHIHTDSISVVSWRAIRYQIKFSFIVFVITPVQCTQS